MKKPIEKQTKKAGLTWLGPAKPDDPVFKEGWLITLPLSGRRSLKPSKSTPDKADVEADESED